MRGTHQGREPPGGQHGLWGAGPGAGDAGTRGARGRRATGRAGHRPRGSAGPPGHRGTGHVGSQPWGHAGPARAAQGVCDGAAGARREEDRGRVREIEGEERGAHLGDPNPAITVTKT
jgi:hypothetical protein